MPVAVSDRMATLMQDLRYGFRVLWKAPGFAAVAVLTLMLGIGANTTIFSVVDRVLLRPLPFPDPDRLVIVWENDRLRGARRERASIPDFVDFQAQVRVFEALAAWQQDDRTLTGEGEPERVVAARVSTGYFSVLGLQPHLGRVFVEEESQLGRHRVVVLSHGLWERRFGSDRGILGKSITLEGENFVVVGVMPRESQIPSNPEELWVPLAFDLKAVYRGMHNVRVYGRLKGGVSLEQAQAEMSTIMSRLEQTYPDDNLGRGAVVIRLHDELVGDMRPALLVLSGAVGFVLLIACANVANLLLARASTRGKEIAVRVALGAGRWRLTRQLLTENMVLAVLGALAGLLFAFWGVDLVRALGPRTIPRLSQVAIDGKVLAFAVSVSLLTWLVFSLAPAIQLAEPRLHDALKESGRSGMPGVGRQRARRYLVMSELALATMLLIGAGLLIRSFTRLLRVAPGYDPKNVLTLNVQLPMSRYPFPQGWPTFDWPQVTAFQTQLLEKVKALRGVESTALALYTPAAGGWTTRMTIVGRPEPPPGRQDEPHFRPVGEEYFQTIRLSVRHGRSFNPQDDAHHPKVVMINEAFRRRYFPTEDPIGRQVRIYGVPREIVGVAGDERFMGLRSEAPPTAYLPLRQTPLNSFSLIVRTDSDPQRLVPSIQKQVWELDRGLAVFDVITLDQALSASVAQRRFTMLLLGSFAAMALLLAAVGVYGVVSFAASRRTHEIGIRMVLGAQRGEVLRLVVGEGLRLSLAGVIAGAAAALGFTRFLETQLFGISKTDVATFLAVPLLLLAVALLACYVPARRATRVDPMVALRYE